MSQTSNYNTRPRPAEVLIEGSQPKLIRRRETMRDLLAPELLTSGLNMLRRSLLSGRCFTAP